MPRHNYKLLHKPTDRTRKERMEKSTWRGRTGVGKRLRRFRRPEPIASAKRALIRSIHFYRASGRKSGSVRASGRRGAVPKGRKLARGESGGCEGLEAVRGRARKADSVL